MSRTDDELRALLAAATPGPWWYQEESDAYTHIVRGEGRRFITQLAQDRSGLAETDARLIAAAVNELPRLLDRVAAAERDAARYRWLREQWVAFHPATGEPSDKHYRDGALDNMVDAHIERDAAMAQGGGRE